MISELLTLPRDLQDVVSSYRRIEQGKIFTGVKPKTGPNISAANFASARLLERTECFGQDARIVFLTHRERVSAEAGEQGCWDISQTYVGGCLNGKNVLPE